MKKLIALTICVGLASSIAADAKPHDKEAKKQQKAEQKVAKQQAKLERAQVNAAQVQQRNAEFRPQVSPQVNVQRQVNVQPQINSTVDAPVVTRTRVAPVTRRGPSNYSWSYDEARRNFHRGVRRDRSWYTSNYSRFALFGGGYYYWDRGYWYPAYGYDSAYSTYRFDEPIYGYNSLEPGQVLVNVQRQLRRAGYYHGAIDGLIGPQTRAALARFQAQNGLYVTRAVDGPTLAALGLT